MGERTLTEGERWTRDQLERLRARRFSPPAVARFLVASWRRSSEVRRQRPELARRAYLWLGLGALAYIARRPRHALSWWAATALMLDWHLGMFETEGGQPREPGPADALTLTRAWLVPFALEHPTPGLIALATATDALDGPLARTGEPTRAGRDLEGLVDFCFLAATLKGTMNRDLLGKTAGMTELTRLTAGLAYALAVYFGRARAPSDAVLRAGRATTALRAGGLALATAGHRRAGTATLAAGSVGSIALLVSSLTREG